MELATVKKEIEQWLTSFVEVPHAALGGWPPCPYARAARLRNSYEVCIGNDPYYDLKNRARWGLNNREIVIYVYDPKQWNSAQLSASVASANLEYLLAKNLIALEDHPDDPEIINGVCMNQGTYALVLVQSLSDLDNKAQSMASKGFYDTWPESYLTELFRHRQDPRS